MPNVENTKGIQTKITFFKHYPFDVLDKYFHTFNLVTSKLHVIKYILS